MIGVLSLLAGKLIFIALEARALFRQLLSAARALPSKRAAAKAEYNIRAAFSLRSKDSGCQSLTAEWLEDGRASLRVLKWLTSIGQVIRPVRAGSLSYIFFSMKASLANIVRLLTAAVCYALQEKYSQVFKDF